MLHLERYKNTWLHFAIILSYTSRASDSVRQKMGNSAAFSRENMRQERSIMWQIMLFSQS